MHLDHYQTEVQRTLAVQDKDERIKLSLIGMTGELGEITDACKKYLYQGHALDRDHIEEEIGDFCWYLATLCNALDISLAHALENNVQKLQCRYPNGFSEECSQKRTT